MKVSIEELKVVNGGGLTSTMLNSVARLITTVLELGRTVGSSIRRIKTKSYC